MGSTEDEMGRETISRGVALCNRPALKDMSAEHGFRECALQTFPSFLSSSRKRWIHRVHPALTFILKTGGEPLLQLCFGLTMILKLVFAPASIRFRKVRFVVDKRPRMLSRRRRPIVIVLRQSSAQVVGRTEVQFTNLVYEHIEVIHKDSVAQNKS